MYVSDLKAKSAVDTITVEVVEVEPEREFTNFRGTGRVANATAKDETGEIKLTLWNEDIDRVSPGSKITIENGWVGEFRGEKQLGAGKFGKLIINGGE